MHSLVVLPQLRPHPHIIRTCSVAFPRTVIMCRRVQYSPRLAFSLNIHFHSCNHSYFRPSNPASSLHVLSVRFRPCHSNTCLWNQIRTFGARRTTAKSRICPCTLETCRMTRRAMLGSPGSYTRFYATYTSALRLLQPCGPQLPLLLLASLRDPGLRLRTLHKADREVMLCNMGAV